MPKLLLDQRNIINRKKLATKISLIAKEKNLKSETSQRLILRLLAEEIKVGKKEIRKRFEKNQNGMQAANLNSFLIDQVLRTLFEIGTLHIYRATNPTKSERLALIATGGYGRSEMAPYSDIDLIFLHPYKLTFWCEQVVEYILYSLWDLGFKLGQSVRTINDCIKISKNDIFTKTSILESRYICGDRKLYDKLRKRYYEEVVLNDKNSFVNSKLIEKNIRHKKFGESRYIVEPNIKEGKGGLRDIQTIFWAAKYSNNIENIDQFFNSSFFTNNEINKYKKSKTFLWTVRFWLHYLSGYAEERLTFNHQIEISKKLNYRTTKSNNSVERFMKRYYLTANEVGSLSRIFFSNIDSEKNLFKKKLTKKIDTILKKNNDIFAEYQDRITIINEDRFFNKPENIIKLFAISQSYDIEIHPKATTILIRNLYRIYKLRKDNESNSIFLQILVSKKNPEKTLRKMNESGLLGRFIPQFGRVVAQTQHDMYHFYTVDEHTIRAIGILNKIESGELNNDHRLASAIIKNITSRRVLYFSVFLHDIAKGQSGDHSKIGEQIARDLCPRFGLDEDEVNEVAWLVRWHLIMSHTAFKRDLGDLKTIEDFAEFVGKKERLDMLLLLTISDISAVGPNTWNAWKGQLIKNLYLSTYDLMDGLVETPLNKRKNIAINKLKSNLKGWSKEDFKKFVNLHYDTYWLSNDLSSQIRHANILKNQNFLNQVLKIDWHNDIINAVTEINVYAPDHPGLFSSLAGSITLAGAIVLDAKVSTTKHGMALDTFWVQNSISLPYSEYADLEKIFRYIENSLKDKNWLVNEYNNKKLSLEQNNNYFEIETKISINNNISNFHTVLEVTTHDKRGLLYEVTESLANLELQISSAHISTYGQRAVDVFYVKDIFGLKVTNKRKINKIINFLKEKIDTNKNNLSRKKIQTNAA
ncbi:MAG: [protein-PII] uridylyltransferase [Rhodospirillaceae bacterium]|nr:[protein-PII] uridylyltransferase [Rhodospirillaceae bacterium]|tara:strand:- start:124946 stop:127723 length:2778 start_codon:yes stop_codon:yes gene_type:complete